MSDDEADETLLPSASRDGREPGPAGAAHETQGVWVKVKSVFTPMRIVTALIVLSLAVVFLVLLINGTLSSIALHALAFVDGLGPWVLCVATLIPGTVLHARAVRAVYPFAVPHVDPLRHLLMASSILNVGCGFLFGVGIGFPVALCGMVLGSMISFAIARRYGLRRFSTYLNQWQYFTVCAMVLLTLRCSTRR